MEKNKIKLYDGKAYGTKVSDYGLDHGYLDYHALSKLVGDMVLNNYIRSETLGDWEMVNGDVEDMVFQDYIISDSGARFLMELTDEYVFYNEKLDMYLWGITHYGTGWDYVLTDVKLIK